MNVERSSTSGAVERLRQVLEERHQQERELIERFVTIMAARHKAFTESIQRSLAIASTVERTQVESIHDTLEAAGEPLTVRELARHTGHAESAVRVAVYSNPSLFERVEISPRRVAWRLRSREDQTTDACMNCVTLSAAD